MLNSLIGLCSDSTPSFLRLFDLSIAPALLYYAYIPIIVASFLFAYLIYRQEKGNLQAKLLLALVSSFVLWVLNIIIQWIAAYHWLIYRSWQITSIFEVLIYIFGISFTYVFLSEGRPVAKPIKYFFWFLFLLTAGLTFTSLNISGYDFENCEGIVGPLWYFIYGFEVITIGWILILTIKKAFNKAIKPEFKKQVAIFGVGIIAFLSFFSFSNIFAEIIQLYEINLIGPLGMIVFLSMMIYIVVKYKAFHAKLLSTQALVYAIWILVFSLIFINNIALIHLIVLITFALLIFVGINLIRSVKNEVRQKEHLADLSQKLADANVHLQDLDKLKTEFLGLASHQLRSPITAIKGYTSMLLEGSYGKIDEQQKIAINRVFQSSVNLGQVVEDLLDVSKIEQGGMVYQMQDVDMAKLAKDLVSEMQLSAKNKNIELTFESNTESCVTVGDPVKLRQVFLNYIDNALKYTPAGTVKVMVTCDTEAKKITLGVKDSGMGIPPEVMSRLFGKFERGEGGKMNAGGSGLGLYLAKEIIAGHKGRTWAESEGRGKGSTFLVELNLK